MFRALIDSDPRRFHRNHGQLDFALKDQGTPAWAEAEAELSTAIELWGPWQEKGWLFYEFNRAICRIRQDPGWEQDQPSDVALRRAILSDLSAAAHSELEELMRSEPTIEKWMRLNSVKTGKLRRAGD